MATGTPQDPFDKINKDKTDMDKKVHEIFPETDKDKIDMGKKDIVEIPVPPSESLQELLRIPHPETPRSDAQRQGNFDSCCNQGDWFQ